MAKINDTTTYPNTAPALTDHVPGTDVSDTGNSVDGETVTFLLSAILDLFELNFTQLETDLDANDFDIYLNGVSRIYLDADDDTYFGSLAVDDYVQLTVGGLTAHQWGTTYSRVGSSTGGANAYIDSAAGFGAQLALRTGTSLRWEIQKNASAEAGSNAGSTLAINAYDDSAVYIDSPITITRAAGGQIDFNRDLDLNGNDIFLSAARLYLDADLDTYWTNDGSDDRIRGYAAGSMQFEIKSDAVRAYQDLEIRQNAGTANLLEYINRTTGFSRWSWGTDADAEAGSDAGSNMELKAFADAGTYIDTPIEIIRAAGGQIDFARDLDMNGNDVFLTGGRYYLDTDNDSYFGSDTDDTIQLVAGGTEIVEFDAAAVDINAALDVNGADISQNEAAAGSSGSLYFDVNDVHRWRVRKNADAESGSNLGSGFQIDAHDDAGTFIDTPFEISRPSSGQIEIGRDIDTNSNDILMGTGRVYFEADLGSSLYASGTDNIKLVAGGTTVWDAGPTYEYHYRAFRLYDDFFIQETSAAGADVAGFGQFWVKNDAPCTLWYVDDTGNEWGVAGAGVGGPSLKFHSGVQQSHTGDTTETTVATVTIPAGAIGANGHVRVYTVGGRNSGGTADVDIRVRFGGLTGQRICGAAMTTSNASTRQFGTVWNRNSASSQLVGSESVSFGSSSNLRTATQNTAAAVDIVFTIQCTNSGDTGYIEAYMVEVYYGA